MTRSPGSPATHPPGPSRSADWHALRHILRKGWLRPGQYREAIEQGERTAGLPQHDVLQVRVTDALAEVLSSEWSQPVRVRISRDRNGDAELIFQKAS